MTLTKEEKQEVLNSITKAHASVRFAMRLATHATRIAADAADAVTRAESDIATVCITLKQLLEN